MKEIVARLIHLDESTNLESLPEVKAMRRIAQLKPDFDADFISRFCVAAGLNDYQEKISPNPDQGSYWGRFVNWAVHNGEVDPPWRRFPNVKARRFDRFRTSDLWQALFLEMDSGEIRASLAEVMRQSPTQKTICFAPLVLARWAYVLGRPFTVVANHPLPIDSRVSRFLEKNPGLDPHEAIEAANESRRRIGRRELSVSDFDAWIWQSGV